ncbi:MAG: alpha/beta hydrolase [Bacteroidia bacterium]|nr:alpha/beta hydrolase [Bacteroidia bacterium]
MQPINSKTLVFIHGLFMNPKSWEPWKRYFEARGYTCYVPPYPYHKGEPADLRKKPHAALGDLSLLNVLDGLSAYIDQLPKKNPILIGHSMGALLVQQLIAINKGVAGICINSAPPQGITSFKWSFIKANLPTINPLKGNTVCLPSVKWFHHAFCNTMTLDETKLEYDKYVVPESRNIPRSSTGAEGKVDFNLPHAPLLFIAGEKDQIIPSSLNKKNYKAYKDKNSRRDFMQFKDRTHYICCQHNWEEVAAFVAVWMNSLH